MDLTALQKLVEAFGPPFALVAGALFLLWLIVSTMLKMLENKDVRSVDMLQKKDEQVVKTIEGITARYETIITNVVKEHKETLEQQREHHRETLKATHDDLRREVMEDLRKEAICKFSESLPPARRVS